MEEIDEWMQEDTKLVRPCSQFAVNVVYRREVSEALDRTGRVGVIPR